MNYFNEVDIYAKKYEVNKKYQDITSNREEIETKWHIGRLIVEAQGGLSRAKYGNELIKKWSQDLTRRYGNGYSNRNLRYMRDFYISFQIRQPLVAKLTWSHILQILPIKNENERNYYINQISERNLSKRNLIEAIKSNEYGRLVNKPEKIDIKPSYEMSTIDNNFKNPIMITIPKNKEIKKEKDLENVILASLRSFFSQLGVGFTFVDNQYPVICDNKKQYIDILLFNIEFNCYVVVELKLRELRTIDEGQIRGYMRAIDNTLKKSLHNKTIGIIISKKNNLFEAKVVKDSDIYLLTYKLEKEP